MARRATLALVLTSSNTVRRAPTIVQPSSESSSTTFFPFFFLLFFTFPRGALGRCAAVSLSVFGFFGPSLNFLFFSHRRNFRRPSPCSFSSVLFLTFLLVLVDLLLGQLLIF